MLSPGNAPGAHSWSSPKGYEGSLSVGDMGGWLNGGSVQGIYLSPGTNPGVDFMAVTATFDSAMASSYEQASERSTGSTYVEYARHASPKLLEEKQHFCRYTLVNQIWIYPVDPVCNPGS